ncbi:MAG: hypothetical protein K9K64_09090 [Desulfohalobiaceae bacterium]|nr:hypothetical protein [Desulfohalobiaceae bacterium]
MSRESQREVFRALRESQSKSTYFLLAAVGAAIGFALTKTQDATLAWSQIPLGIAVLLWGASFFCGCYNLFYVNSTLYGNLEMLKINSGSHPQIGSDTIKIKAASLGIREAIDHNSKRSNQYGHWQFILLVGGAIFYVLWHVIEMYLRTSYYF